ncbi:glycosyltransferase family 2 protein [Necropsobacter rosorum]|uniref:glycosyltransferase family 2 protein n=1 Tax=Necropsobacter rosorum TaxID=908285 RepID=UPI000509B60C
MLSITLIVPTFNAGDLWVEWIAQLKLQTIRIEEVIVIDSSSVDNTANLAKQAGFSTYCIEKSDFNHGRTRNQAVMLCKKDSDILVFLTQDALLASADALQCLVNCFSDASVSAAYGRQLPHKDANPIAAHARLFNYPAHSVTKEKRDITELGIKTAFMSNSFAAYRRSVFTALGGFPNDVILAEDMYLAAKMILANYKIAYCADAMVYHSHNYSYCQEVKRYFDTGVFHAKVRWIKENFGGVKGEGKKFVISELKYLLKHAPLWIPKAMLTTLFKAIGFKLGLNWNKLPKYIIKKCSMHKGYWER